ncbi:MAG: hypothetical protein NUV67_03875 [archaeon]|nr:hypothetical protein [archaeon]
MSLEEFLLKKNLALVEKVAKGWSSYIFLVKDSSGKKFAVKALREKSNRRSMAMREAENLALANRVNVGPELVDADPAHGCVLMEFVEGERFSDWLSSPIGEKELHVFLRGLFSQAKRLDSIGLDHGQLAGKGRNILVRDGLPVIIDFEKASARRKVHNVSSLESYLFRNPGSGTALRVRTIMHMDAHRLCQEFAPKK